MSDRVDPASAEAATLPTPTPTPPRDVDAEGRAVLEGRARTLVGELVAHPDDRQGARRLAALGGDAATRASEQIDLLKTRVGALLNELEGPGARIPRGLRELRRTMDEIAPHVALSKPRGFVSRLLRRTPVVGDVLADIAVKYESAQTQIDAIVEALRVGKDELLADSVELERLYATVQDHQVEVQKAAYLGELVWTEIETARSAATDAREQQRLAEVAHRVAMRVQDLRTLEQVNAQFFVSIELTIANNDHLSDSITRTITVTRSLLTVGLAIQAALARQKKIAGAVRETQAYTSDMLAANAAAIRQQTAEIGDLHENPVLALDKVKAAYAELLAAMEELDAIRRAGTEKARDEIAQLAAMTEGLAPRVDALREAREFEVPDAQ